MLSIASDNSELSVQGATSGIVFLFAESLNLLLFLQQRRRKAMSDYNMMTMQIETSSVFFGRLTYALFIGWVVYCKRRSKNPSLEAAE
jgi:hypothetical protein